MPSNEVIQGLGLDDYKFGFVTDSEPVFKTRPGLDAEVVPADFGAARTNPSGC